MPFKKGGLRLKKGAVVVKHHYNRSSALRAALGAKGDGLKSSMYRRVT